MKILFVEDNPTTRKYVQKGLSEQGFVVDVAAGGDTGLALAIDASYDLLILDVMLADCDGFEILAKVRGQKVDTPVLFLSARGEPEDRIRGLDLGADDYLTKPFEFGELVARIRAIARRALGEPSDGVLAVDDLRLDLRARRVTRRGQAIKLTPKEFVLLSFLMRNANHVLSRTMILEHVWGGGFENYSNVVDVHITNLRKKVDRDFEPKLIRTISRIGYVLESTSDAA